MDPTIELRISISCMHVLDVYIIYNIYICTHNCKLRNNHHYLSIRIVHTDICRSMHMLDCSAMTPFPVFQLRRIHLLGSLYRGRTARMANSRCLGVGTWPETGHRDIYLGPWKHA